MKTCFYYTWSTVIFVFDLKGCFIHLLSYLSVVGYQIHFVKLFFAGIWEIMSL